MPEFSNYVEGLTPVVGALSGDEIVPVSKDGDAVSITSQQIADLADPAGKQNLVNAAVVLTSGASIDLTAIKHTLTTALSAITFTISYTGDDITIEVTLNATSSTFTFPAGTLCVSEGVASGDNTAGLAGVSGDIYMITIKKIGSTYRAVVKNFLQ